jgi:DNA-binding Xre family transcriptional regulator
MRVDKQKNIKALKNELMKNPLQTEEELAKKIGIARGSVNRLKDEMSEIVTNAKNSDIIEITDEDKLIIQMSQAISRHSL